METEREITAGPTRIGQFYESKSGREWEVIRVWRSEEQYRSFATMMPLGPGANGHGGGVKCRRVELERLDRQTHGWRWLHGRSAR